MTDGAAPPRRRRRTPWLGLLARVFVLAAASLAAGWLLFRPQLSGLVQSLNVVTVGVHNGTSEAIRVSTVAPRGERSFYTVAAGDTRLIPDDPDEVVTILDGDCRVLDARDRGRQPPAYLLADVTDAGVTWEVPPDPAGLEPAARGEPCAVE